MGKHRGVAGLAAAAVTMCSLAGCGVSADTGSQTAGEAKTVGIYEDGFYDLNFYSASTDHKENYVSVDGDCCIYLSYSVQIP